MVTRNDSLWKSLDWVTICIYLLLIVGGWFSVCGASYDYGDRDFLDFSTRAGKQFVWIICSFGLGFQEGCCRNPQRASRPRIWRNCLGGQARIRRSFLHLHLCGRKPRRL